MVCNISIFCLSWSGRFDYSCRVSFFFWFCPRVSVHKNRKQRPNNIQQLSKGLKGRRYNGYSPVYRYTRTTGNPCLSQIFLALAVARKQITGSVNRTLKIFYIQNVQRYSICSFQYNSSPICRDKTVIQLSFAEDTD